MLKLSINPTSPLPAASAQLTASAKLSSSSSSRLDELGARGAAQDARGLAELARISKDSFAGPSAAELGLGRGASAFERLGAKPEGSRAEQLKNPTGSLQSPRDRNPLAPSTDPGALFGGLNRTGPKESGPVPGQHSDNTDKRTGLGSTVTLHRDGSIVTRERSVDQDGTLVITSTRERVDRSSVRQTFVLAGDGRSYRSTEHVGPDGQTTRASFRGDRGLLVARGRGQGIDRLPTDDAADASLLPPWVKPEVGAPPSSANRERTDRDAPVVTGERLPVDPKDLVSDPRSRQAVKDLAGRKLGTWDDEKLVLPPRAGLFKA